MSDPRTPGRIAYEAHNAQLLLDYDGRIRVHTWDSWEQCVRDRWEAAATAVREADAKEIARLNARVAELESNLEGLWEAFNDQTLRD